MKIAYYHIDAFTDKTFSGNPAAVCILEQWLPEKSLQAIANENHLHATAFLVRHQERDCRFIDGYYLDIFIYSEEVIQSPDNYLIHIKDGIVLCQKDNLDSALLKKIHTIFNAGPTPIPE